jgi:hypothetical protein
MSEEINSYPIDLGNVQITVKLTALQDNEEREETDACRQ